MTDTVRSSIVAAGVGAGVMFLLDPARGARRRALVRDKMVWLSRKSCDAYEATWRDLNNRIRGLAAETWRASDEPVDESVLCERVRAELGRVASHPRAIDVFARGDHVTLTGDVLAWEGLAIVRAVECVRGVAGVENRLRTHATAGDVPSLQGTSERPGHWSVWLREGWSPTAMLIVGAGTAAIAAATMIRRAA